MGSRSCCSLRKPIAAPNAKRVFANSNSYSLRGAQSGGDRAFDKRSQQIVAAKEKPRPAFPALKRYDLPVAARRKFRHAGIPLERIQGSRFDAIQLPQVVQQTGGGNV